MRYPMRTRRLCALSWRLMAGSEKQGLFAMRGGTGSAKLDSHEDARPHCKKAGHPARCPPRYAKRWGEFAANVPVPGALRGQGHPPALHQVTRQAGFSFHAVPFPLFPNSPILPPLPGKWKRRPRVPKAPPFAKGDKPNSVAGTFIPSDDHFSHPAETGCPPRTSGGCD